MKSKTELKRLFMIDIIEKGKTELELILHFINKDYSPLQSPIIKRFIMSVDAQTQEFLILLEQEVAKNSQYYLSSRVPEAN